MAHWLLAEEIGLVASILLEGILLVGVWESDVRFDIELGSAMGLLSVLLDGKRVIKLLVVVGKIELVIGRLWQLIHVIEVKVFLRGGIDLLLLEHLSLQVWLEGDAMVAIDLGLTLDLVVKTAGKAAVLGLLDAAYLIKRSRLLLFSLLFPQLLEDTQRGLELFSVVSSRPLV